MFPKELFENLPSWFFTTASLIMLVGMGIMVWWIVLGAKRFSDALGKENRLICLQDNLREMEKSEEQSRNIASQVTTALQNIKKYMLDLNSMRIDDTQDIDSKINGFLQRIIDGLSSDVKFKPGDRHRCGLWIEDESGLVLLKGSSEFPEDYIGTRRLDLNWSIAGKSFRKGITIIRDDVSEDDDWKPNEDSRSECKAIICIPIAEWGVLTIDALNPMKQEVIAIGELYATLIQGAMEVHMRGIAMMGTSSYSEVSVSSDES